MDLQTILHGILGIATLTEGMSSNMLTTALTGCQSWTSHTICPPKAWSYPFPKDCRSLFSRWINQVNYHSGTITKVPFESSGSDVCRSSLVGLRTELNSGRGFAVLDRIPLEQYSVREAPAIY